MNYFKYFIGKNQDVFKIWLLIFVGFFLLNSCGWLIVGGGGAYQGYKSATDPRSIGREIDDAKITAEIKLKLLQDPITKARKIDVDTVNGVVTLTGLVETEKEIKRAIEIAKSVKGVKEVINNLKVGKRGVITYLSDKEITTRVKIKFMQDPELKAFSIDVDTLNGVVTLTGIVKTEAQKKKAVELAKSVPGVKGVKDNIQVVEK
ncbi:MAG: transporter [Thermodesulfobacteriota bacterium]|nr:MAG: transporter [Thermodesulfobacteriota bacterium]